MSNIGRSSRRSSARRRRKSSRARWLSSLVEALESAPRPPKPWRARVLRWLCSTVTWNPGKDFGPYGLPKAATLFLVKQYALDHGKDGIRSNAVNADRIRTGLLTPDMVKARAGARGISEADYMAGNLLQREVTADDVAE